MDVTVRTRENDSRIAPEGGMGIKKAPGSVHTVSGLSDSDFVCYCLICGLFF